MNEIGNLILAADHSLFVVLLDEFSKSSVEHQLVEFVVDGVACPFCLLPCLVEVSHIVAEDIILMEPNVSLDVNFTAGVAVDSCDD